MNFFSKLLGRQPASATNGGRGAREATTAIRNARAGQTSVPEMLRVVLASQVVVPLASPPSMEGDIVKSWKPATVTKQNGGAQFLVAFTDDNLATSFMKNNPEHSHGLLVDLQWVLSALPQHHGIAINIGGDDTMFEWSAEGIAAYRRQAGGNAS